MSEYNVGDKFVLEVLAVTQEMEEPLYMMNNSVCDRIFSESALDGMERLDSDYLNENFGELQDEVYKDGYNEGLEDAWKLIRKVVLTRCNNENALMPSEIKEIFGMTDYEIIKNMTVHEVLAKIKAYEESKEIKVGDVVQTYNAREYVVIATAEEMPNNQPVLRNLHDNSVCFETNENLIKTGKHIDIQKLLDELKEGVKNAID